MSIRLRYHNDEHHCECDCFQCRAMRRSLRREIGYGFEPEFPGEEPSIEPKLRSMVSSPFEKELIPELIEAVDDHPYDIVMPIDGCECVICQGLRMYHGNRRNHPGIRRGQRRTFMDLLVYGLTTVGEKIGIFVRRS